MPTYQYTCTECSHDLEARQSFTDPALTLCPACGVEALRKQYGSVGVVFKGSGFYRNDSRSSNSTELSKNDSSESKDKSDSAKSESKSETKSETKSDSAKSGSTTPAKKKETAAAKS